MPDSDEFTFADAQLWNLPSVDDEEAKLDGATNALNRPKNKWKFEAPEAEEEIKPLTAKDIEQIRAQAYQEGLASGHQEGFTKGHEEGLVQGKEVGIAQGSEEGLSAGKLASKEKADAQMLALGSILDSLSAPLKSVSHEVKNELVILAISLAQAIIKTQVDVDPQVILHAIEEGMKTLPLHETQYQISLHPDDLALVTEHFTSQTIHDNKWQLIASSKLTRGGCYIHTSNNAVDVSIERRSEQVFMQLLLNQGLADDPRTT